MGPDKPALPLVDLDIVIKCSKLWVRRLVETIAIGAKQ